MNFPILKQGIDWEPVGNWPLVMLRTVADDTPFKGTHLRFFNQGKLLGELHPDGVMEIKRGYACDGFSPVLKVFGKFIRLTPTPESGMWSAVRHDFFRQFSVVEGCPWTREDTDTLFYNDLVRGGMSQHMAGTYYGAVAGTAGDLFLALTRKSAEGLHIQKIV